MPIIGMMIFAMLVQGGAAAYQAYQSKEAQRDFLKAQRQAEVERQQKVEGLRQQMKDARTRAATDYKARLTARAEASASEKAMATPQPQQKPESGITGAYLGGF